MWKHQNNPACTKSVKVFKLLKLDTTQKKKKEIFMRSVTKITEIHTASSVEAMPESGDSSVAELRIK